MLVRVIALNFRALPHICLINACMRQQILLRSTSLKKSSPHATVLHENYLCLVESNKQQIEVVRSKIPAENSETGNTPKRVWIRPMHRASVAFS